MKDKKPLPTKRDNRPALRSSNEASGAGPAGATATGAAAPKVSASSGSSSATPAASTRADVRTKEPGGGGWLAALALLFGLLGTGFSAYLYSQLSALRNQTTNEITSQTEALKSSVANVQTELEGRTADLGQTLEQQTSSLSAALQEKTSNLQTLFEQKTGELAERLQSTSDDLHLEASRNKVEIATNTVAAVQELTSKTELEINNVSTSVNTGLALLRERNAEKFTEIDGALNRLDESVKATNELASRGQRDWVLAEVNYLLRTAVHRVKLAGDVEASIIALESASERLHTLGDIDYLPVREQIHEEVGALRRVGPPDIEGLIFRLQELSNRADYLPLPPSEMDKAKEAEAGDVTAGGLALGQSLLNRLKGTVKIVPSDVAAEAVQNEKATKPTSEQLTATEGLRLHLQAARLSALRHDPDSFVNHMDNAIAYAAGIFDQNNDRVQAFVGDLQHIRETNIVPKIPILGSALALFTKIDSKRGDN